MIVLGLHCSTSPKILLNPQTEMSYGQPKTHKAIANLKILAHFAHPSVVSRFISPYKIWSLGLTPSLAWEQYCRCIIYHYLFVFALWSSFHAAMHTHSCMCFKQNPIKVLVWTQVTRWGRTTLDPLSMWHLNFVSGFQNDSISEVLINMLGCTHADSLDQDVWDEHFNPMWLNGW